MALHWPLGPRQGSNAGYMPGGFDGHFAFQPGDNIHTQR